MLTCMQKINFIIHFLKILQRNGKIASFGLFVHYWLPTPKVITSTCWIPLCLSAGITSISSPAFFWRYCKDIQTSYFGHFESVRLRTPKLIVSTCRKL